MNQVLWFLAVVGIAGVVYIVVRATRRKEVIATRSVALESEGGCLARVAAAVESLRGVRDVEIDEESREVRARTGLNPLTFGEDIVAEVRESGPSDEVTISSVCRYTSTAFDWGKNRRNVDHIVQALVSPYLTEPPPPPLAASAG